MPENKKAAESLWDQRHSAAAFAAIRATRAVIGTLRPTERRRAANLKTFYTI
jgi:hypothetical protein